MYNVYIICLEQFHKNLLMTIQGNWDQSSSTDKLHNSIIQVAQLSQRVRAMFSYWLFRFHIYQCTITFCWKFHVINKAWSLVVRFSRSTNSAAKRYNLTPPLTVQADIGRKSRFLPQLRGPRRGFCDSVWYGKTITLGHRYPTLKKIWTHVHLFLQNTRTWQTDGRTDGHRTTALMHSITRQKLEKFGLEQV